MFFLANFRSTFCREVSSDGRAIAISDYYHPWDIFSVVQPSSEEFDKLLHTVTALDVLDYLTRDNRGIFSMESLWNNISKSVEDSELKTLLIGLWAIP